MHLNVNEIRLAIGGITLLFCCIPRDTYGLKIRICQYYLHICYLVRYCVYNYYTYAKSMLPISPTSPPKKKLVSSISIFSTFIT